MRPVPAGIVFFFISSICISGTSAAASPDRGEDGARGAAEAVTLAAEAAVRGCGDPVGLDCDEVPLFVAGLLGMGEYLAAQALCTGLDRRNELDPDALESCATAAARLGDTRPAIRWLKRVVETSGKGRAMTDAALRAADLLISEARYQAAAKFLEMAAAGGGSTELDRKTFSNCLDAGDAMCATSMAERIAGADQTGDGALFTIREFFSHDLYQAALPIADLLQTRGISTMEQLGVVLQVYAKNAVRDRAVTAAATCLERCPGADVGVIAATMSRSLMKREAAEFAQRFIGRFRDPATAGLELARLWLAAGDVERASTVLKAWVLEARTGASSGAELSAMDGRLLAAVRCLRAERKNAAALKLLDEVKLPENVASPGFFDAAASLRVESLAGLKKWDRARDAAIAALPTAGDTQALSCRLAAILFDGRQYADAAAVLKAGAGARSADDVVRAGCDLVTARLVEAGAIEGDVRALIRRALENAGGDRQMVRSIVKFMGALKLPPEFEILAQVNMAAANPDNPEEFRKLADLYVKNGMEDEALDAFSLLLGKVPDRARELTEAVDRMLAAGFHGGAVDLAGRTGTVVPLAPQVARRLSDSCVKIGERECVRRFLPVFLAGPIDEDYDYIELAENLVSGGMYRLAGDVLDVAVKAIATDRPWRVDLLRGRIALFSGESVQAAKFYRRVMTAVPDAPAVALAISSDYSRRGRLGDSIEWIEAAMRIQGSSAQAKVFPLLVNTMRRLGRTATIDSRPVEGLLEPYLRARGESIDALIAAGRFDLARRLLDGMDQDWSVGAVLKRIELAGLLDDGQYAKDSAGAVCNAPDRYAEGACADVCAALADAGWPGEAWIMLSGRLDRADGRVSGRMAAAITGAALRRGDVQTAMKAAVFLTPEVYQKSARVEDVWPTLPGMAGRAAFNELLQRLASMTDFDSDGRVLLEAGAAAVTAGQRDRGMEMISRYALAGTPMLAASFRQLVVSGLAAEAFEILDSAPASLIDGLGAPELSMILATYFTRGMTGAARKFQTRYLDANDGSSDARLNIALASLSIVDARQAVKEMKKLDGPRMGPRERLQYGAILWATGDRTAAVGQFRKVLAADGGDEEKAAYRKFVLGFLESEDAMAEISGLFMDPPVPAKRDAAEDMLRAVAGASLSGQSNLDDARAALFRVVRSLRSITGAKSGETARDIAGYIRIEARRGTVGDLGVQALRHKGASFAQTALMAACLAGDEATMSAAMSRLIPPPMTSESPVLDEVADPVDMLTIADVLFQCGRWAEASDAAVRYMTMFDLDIPEMVRAVGIAVRGALAASRNNPVTPEFVASVTDDDLLRFTLDAASARAAGQPEGDLKAVRRGMTLMREESTLFMDAIAAGTRAGLKNDDLASLAGEMLDKLAFPGRHHGRVIATMLDTFNAPAARTFIKRYALADVMTVDRAMEMFRAAVDLDDAGEAGKLAQWLLELHSDRTRMSAALLATAALSLRPSIARGLARSMMSDGAERPADGSQPPEVVDQLFAAAQALARTGVDDALASELTAFAVRIARDVPGACGQLAARVLSGGPLELSFQSAARALVGNGACRSDELRDRMADIDEVSSRSPADSRIRGRYPDETWMQIMIRAARAAMIEGRYRDAADWCTTAFNRFNSFGDRVQITQALVDYMGDQTAVGPADRAFLADFVLDTLAAGGIDSGRLALLKAQIVAMGEPVNPRPIIVEAMEREIAISPSSPSARNNLAYTLSTNGLDQKRAIAEIHLANALAGSDRGAYLETEAWAWFMYGKPGRALQIQNLAGLYWNKSDYSVGLAECFNHLGMIHLALGHRDQAAEAFRRAASAGDAWNWHSVLSVRKLRELGFFKTENK